MVVIKLSDCGDLQDGVVTVGPVETPLVRLRVIEAEREALNVSLRAVDVEFTDLGPTIPQFSYDRCRYNSPQVSEPVSGCVRRLRCAFQLPDFKVEVVLVVAAPGSRTNVCDPLTLS